MEKPGQPKSRLIKPNASKLATFFKHTNNKIGDSTATAEFYVSVKGSPEGKGTITEPWDLSTALAKTAVVQPGSIIWVRGGTYTGAFTSRLSGTAALPIIIRQYPGERVKIEAGASIGTSTITVNGSYTWLWGFEISGSNTGRYFIPSLLSQRSVAGVSLNASHIKLINLIVHDTKSGIYVYPRAKDTEIYGCLVYNNDLSLTMHERGAELQNQIEPAQVLDTLVFNNHGLGFIDWKFGLCTGGMSNINGSKGILSGSPLKQVGVVNNLKCERALDISGMEFRQVAVLPNHYEPGRAHVVIHNKERQNSVSVNFADSGMKPGDTYELRDVQSYFDEPIIKGVYDGLPVSIPMTRLQVAPTIETSIENSHTARELGVFVLKSAFTEIESVPDTITPILRLLTPRRNTTVSGIVSITASASDDIGISRVEFYDNDILLGTDTQSPYAFTWDTSTCPEGVHQVSIEAFDAAGNQQIALAKVKIHNSAPSSAPTVTFIATPPVVSPGLPSTLSWVSSNATSISINQGIGAVSAIGTRVVTPTQTTTYTLTATNSTGTVIKTATVTISPDTTPPTVSMVTPIVGTTVSGTTPVSALAVDNIGVVGVQFKLDGANLGAEDLTSPYSLSWNSATVSNGSHTVTATARDASGNSATSLPVTFTVTNTVPSGNNITLVPTTTYQTMRGWEATAYVAQEEYPTTYTNWQAAMLDAAVDVGINRLRVELPSGTENPTDYFQQYVNGQIPISGANGQRYNIINDNNDPNTINPNGFKWARFDLRMDAVVMPLRQRLAARGETLYITVCYVDFDPSTFEHKNNPAEYAELVLATYQHMQSKYGIVPDAWEVILEPDNSSAGWVSNQIADCVVAAQNRLLAAGITPNFSLPSTLNGWNTVNFYNLIKARNPNAITYVSEVGYHRYGSINTTQLTTLRNTVQADGKTTMMSEWIGAGYDTLHTDLTVGNNTSWQQFVVGGLLSWGDTGAQLLLVNPTTSAVTYGSRTKFLRQYFKFVRRGAVRIGGNSSNTSLAPVAFINTNGKYVVVVKATAGLSFNTIGLPAGTYGIKYTTSSQYNIDKADQIIIPGGTLSTSIPAAGVITIYAK